MKSVMTHRHTASVTATLIATATNIMMHGCLTGTSNVAGAGLPGVECLGVILVQLVGAGIDDSVLGQTIFGPAKSRNVK